MYRTTKRALERRRRPAQGRDPTAPERVDAWRPPELRRVIEITDYDGDEPRVYRMELRRSNRVDCYDAYINGQLWQRRIGWSRILAGLRKALPRVMAAE